MKFFHSGYFVINDFSRSEVLEKLITEYCADKLYLTHYRLEQGAKPVNIYQVVIWRSYQFLKSGDFSNRGWLGKLQSHLSQMMCYYHHRKLSKLLEVNCFDVKLDSSNNIVVS